MQAKDLNGTVYRHPIGQRPRCRSPDRALGLSGRGSRPRRPQVIPTMWYSTELQVTTPVAEWGEQRVRMAQEEDFTIDAAGKVRWALKRQDALFLVR